MRPTSCIEIWKKLGVPDDHISRLGEDDNFWRAGPPALRSVLRAVLRPGPPEFGCGSPDCAPGLRLRPFPRVLELRVHPVRRPGGRHARPR